MPRFTVFHHGFARSLSVDEDEILIGRMPGIAIELATATVSRQHARIKRDGEGWVIDDLGSVNGIFVNGHAVRGHVLAPGDKVRIEDYTIVFEPPDDVYAAALGAAPEAEEGGARRWNMTYLSARKFLDEGDGAGEKKDEE